MTRDELLKLCDYLECNDASMEAQCEAVAFIRQTLAKPTWVGLTDEERDEICLGDESIARSIEAKLREKNGGNHGS